MSWLSQSLLVNCRLSSCCLFVVLLLFRVILDSFFCLFSFVCLTLTRDKFQSSRFADVKRWRCFCHPSLYALPNAETTTATTKPIYNTHKTYSIYCYYLLLFVVAVFLLCHKTCFNSWFYLFLFFPALFFASCWLCWIMAAVIPDSDTKVSCFSELPTSDELTQRMAK